MEKKITAVRRGSRIKGQIDGRKLKCLINISSFEKRERRRPGLASLMRRFGRQHALVTQSRLSQVKLRSRTWVFKEKPVDGMAG